MRRCQKKTETKETIVVFATFLSSIAFQLGGGAGSLSPPPAGYAYANECKGNGQRELQEQASKSKKKRSIAASASKLGRKSILSYIEAIKGINTQNAIFAE